MIEKEKKLLFSITKDDLKIQTFCSGGPGGQNQNKRFTGVRIIHKESGAIGESREERSQLQNKRTALKRLSEHPKFKIWIARKIDEINGKESIDESVAKWMSPENLKFEVKDGTGNWIIE